MGKNVYAIVTERITKLIEEAITTDGLLPWQKPWFFAKAPRNYVSQKQYRGVNNLLLEGGEYITWSQICDLQKHDHAIKLKKGSKSDIVVFFQFSEREQETSVADGTLVKEERRISFLRYYNVYNINCVEGIESRQISQSYEHHPIAEAQDLMDSYIRREGIVLSEELGDKACYNPASDKLTLPLMEQFPDQVEYYCTAFHELIHSTGKENRLNRHEMARFGDERYSKEELVAELGAAMLLGRCGVTTPTVERNSAAYIRSWLKALKDNQSLIVSASWKAEKACDFIVLSE